jgi:hypothetical protein
VGENTRLRERIGDLERENHRLQTLVGQLRADQQRKGRLSAPPPVMPGRPAPPSVPSGRALLTLRIRSATSRDRPDETFDCDVIKIGRLPSCHLLLDHRDVSRMHAVIERTSDGFVIIDLGSSTGTLVNGRKINKTSLATQDSITIGPFLLTVAIGS